MMHVRVTSAPLIRHAHMYVSNKLIGKIQTRNMERKSSITLFRSMTIYHKIFLDISHIQMKCGKYPKIFRGILLVPQHTYFWMPCGWNTIMGLQILCATNNTMFKQQEQLCNPLHSSLYKWYPYKCYNFIYVKKI